MMIAIILGIVVILALYAMNLYNKLIKSSNTCEEAFATMDVYLKKRYDLIPNIVNTVKGYAAHENSTLKEVIAMRNSAADASDPATVMKANADLSKGISKIFALAEAYPDLKANTNFIALQEQLGTIEKEIANARKYYNGCVKSFNDTMMVFPNNFFAGAFGFKKKPMFEVTDEIERENVKVEF